MMLRNLKVLKKSESRQINAHSRHVFFFYFQTGVGLGLPAYISQDSDISNSFLFYYTPISYLRGIKKPNTTSLYLSNVRLSITLSAHQFQSKRA